MYVRKDRKLIKQLKTLIGKLKMDIWLLLPYRDFPETKKELEDLELQLSTAKDRLKIELVGEVLA